MALPPTMHRAYFRARAHPRLWDSTGNHLGLVRGPCEVGSRWHRHTFTINDLYPVPKTVVITDNDVDAPGKFTLRVDGVLRTELDWFDGCSWTELNPTSIPPQVNSLTMSETPTPSGSTFSSTPSISETPSSTAVKCEGWDPDTGLCSMRYISGSHCNPGEAGHPCPPCYGDCDSNDGCAPGLICLQRQISNSFTPVPPGCYDGSGSGFGGFDGDTDFCYSPVPHELTYGGGGYCSDTTPCEACHGDCDNRFHCKWQEGQACWGRSIDDPTTDIPGCTAGGVGDRFAVDGTDYCYSPPPWYGGLPFRHRMLGGPSLPCLPRSV